MLKRLFITGSIALLSSTGFAGTTCDINPHLLNALKTITQRTCELIKAEDLLKISSITVDLQGSKLAASDFPEGLLPESFTATNVGNDTIVDVLKPLARVRGLKLALSFAGQVVNFHDARNEYRGFFKDLELAELHLDNFQIKFRQTFATDIEHMLGDQHRTTKLSITRTNIQYIPFHMFDEGPLNTMQSVDFSNNQIEWFVGNVVSELPNLKFIDLSGNPLRDNFKMEFVNCGKITVKACNMGSDFDRAKFLANVVRHKNHSACLCDGNGTPCKLTFEFCD